MIRFWATLNTTTPHWYGCRLAARVPSLPRPVQEAGARCRTYNASAVKGSNKEQRRATGHCPPDEGCATTVQRSLSATRRRVQSLRLDGPCGGNAKPVGG